ncbi:MAG: nucleotidyltransferase family protein [Clostridia bacterium]|nr:nucleotidyltransferase family protein [Clostridia bacterium]
MKKVNVLAELLNCALFDETIEESVKKTITDNLSVIYNVSLRHDLVHLVEHAFGKSAIAVSDEGMAYDFLKQKALSVMRYEDIKRVQKQVSELFEKEKIPFVLLKGAVIRNLYPEPWMRTSCDVDVLVHKEDLERARDVAVEKLGFSADREMHYHDISLHSDTDVHVELHFNIKENMDNIDSLLENVWEYASPVNDGASEHVLTNEFFVFQNIAHMSYHFVGGGCGIRSFIDLFLIKKNMSFDEAKLLDMLEKCGIRTFYEACVRYAEVWFTDREHDDVTRLMHSYLLEGGTYGSKQKSILSKNINKSKFSYIFERIFLPYEHLCITYPKLKGKPFLTPFYQLKRWCRIVSKGRAGISAKEIVVCSNISDENKKQMADMFEKVGLINAVIKKQG